MGGNVPIGIVRPCSARLEWNLSSNAGNEDVVATLYVAHSMKF